MSFAIPKLSKVFQNNQSVVKLFDTVGKMRNKPLKQNLKTFFFQKLFGFAKQQGVKLIKPSKNFAKLGFDTICATWCIKSFSNSKTESLRNNQSVEWF